MTPQAVAYYIPPRHIILTTGQLPFICPAFNKGAAGHRTQMVYGSGNSKVE